MTGSQGAECMSPPKDRDSRPDLEENTGITSISTKTLLEGLVSDVRAARSEIASTAGVVIRIEDRQKDLASKMLDQERRLTEIEVQFREHQNEEKLWQLQNQQEMKNVATQLGLIGPLTASHEQLLQQAKGAVTATKTMYAVLGGVVGLLGGGGVLAVVQFLVSKH